MNFSNPQTVLFADGSVGRCQVLVYGGACLKGDPTAYVVRKGRIVWVVPGESVSWVEVPERPQGLNVPLMMEQIGGMHS